MQSSYCHLTDDKIVKEHEKRPFLNKALLLTLKVNSEQQISHMEPNSAVCVNFSGANWYLRDKNAILS